MHIGIVVYSKTGHTYSVAQRLSEKLSALGHTAEVERVAPDDEAQADIRRISFASLPEPGKYDALVFCSPVQAFSLVPAMRACLAQMEPAGGKKAACFVTKQLKAAWMGGNRAIAQMSRALTAGGAEIVATGMVCWSSPSREDDIAALVEKIAGAF